MHATVPNWPLYFAAGIYALVFFIIASASYRQLFMSPVVITSHSRWTYALGLFAGVYCGSFALVVATAAVGWFR
jgi:uncharacterized membrane protein